MKGRPLMRLIQYVFFIFVTAFLVGCGAVQDRIIPSITLEIPADSLSQSGDLVAFIPYNRRHFFSTEALTEFTRSEPGYKKTVLTVDASKSTTLTLMGGIRAESFWIIPPVGSYFADEGNYLLLKTPDGKIWGVELQGKSLTVYTVSKSGDLEKDAVETANGRFALNTAPESRMGLHILWKTPQ